MDKKKNGMLKPIRTAKAVVIYVVCLVLIAAMLVGNYFADAYRELITVYLSGSGTVSSKESEALCQEIEQEGMVLLKNEGGLPLASGAKVSVFGQDSVDFVYGGAGSGAVDTSKAANLKQALETAGFSVNPTLWDFYATGPGKGYRKTTPDETGAGVFAVNEVPVSVYTDDVKSSFSSFGDAAVVCIGRSGGESADIPTTPLETGALYLELDPEELAMLSMACGSFDNVVLLLNSNNPVELGFLDDPAYVNVKAVLWCGGVGQTGIYAIGEALAGTVNPSGKLVDTYAYDSLSAPSAANLGDYTITNSTVGNGNKYLVYAEGIYVGYRYYETRYEDTVMGQGNAGDYDYAATVQFPFGYGLSYTTFSWSDFQVEEKEDAFEVSVTVTNTGSQAGKDVVEIYLQSPYTDYDRENGIEKAAVTLAGFAKTKVLEPGDSEDVTITVPKELMKSYDAKGAGTYILDAGDYYLTAGHDAHDAVNNILSAKGYTVSQGMTAEGDPAMTWKTTVSSQDNAVYSVSLATGTAIVNQFDDVDIRYYDGNFTYLSRSDWTGTWPTTYQNGSWQAPGTLLKDLLWKRDASVVGSGGDSMPAFEQDSDQTVSDLAGTDYSDEDWQELVERLTPDQAMRLVRLGGYATIQMDAIGLPATQDKDGPSGISGTLVGGQSATAYPVEVVMASTWNTELIQRLGESVGDDSVATGVAGWYAPGVNIHRSPYSGRNFEYFSEDGFLSGKISAAEVRGTRSKGVLTYMKHFALNDQESNRYGAAFFANEQAIREIFLKGFEYTVTEGDSNGAMAAMNRLGATWSGSHKGLMTNVLREEWGFEGCVITDQASVPAMFYQDMVSGLAAGADLWLNTNKNYWQLNAYAEIDGTVTDWTGNAAVMANVQRAAKNIIYAVSTTNAMEKAGHASMPAWQVALIILNILVFGGAAILLAWTTLRLVITLKSKPKTAKQEEGDGIVKKKIVAILTVAALVIGLAAGALVMFLVKGGSSSAGGANVIGVYVYGEAAGNSMGDNDFVEYELTLYEDGTYKLTTSTASCGYSMLLSNTVVNAYGTYTKGTSADGYTPCQLSEATRIVYNGYSDVGGYNMSYDTDTIASWPVELPGGVMTEQVDFWAQFGTARTVSLDDTAASRMMLTTGAAAPNPIGGKGDQSDEPTDATTQPAQDETQPAQTAPTEGATVTSDDGATTLTFNSDGTYVFKFESYGVEDAGTYTFEGGVLTLTNSNGAEATAEGDPLKLHYVTAVSDQLTGDFTIDPKDLPAAGGESTPAEGFTVTSDDGATTLTFNSDGTYVFKFESYSVEDTGTYTFEGGVLTLTNSNGVEATAEGDPLKLHYVTAVSDQLTGDFTIDPKDLPAAGGESTPAEGFTVTSDDGATTLTFNSDGTYVFKFESYSVEDAGTYTFEGGVLTLTNSKGAEATAEGDPLKLHYVTAVSDQLTGDFTIDPKDLG